MATGAGTASSADFDFVDLVETLLREKGISLTFFARLKLRGMYGGAIRRLNQAGEWYDLAAADSSARRLANKLIALDKPRISRSALGNVVSFLCPGLYPIC